MVVAFPSISLIDNIGFDGTGIHSEKTNVFNHDNHHHTQPIDYSRILDSLEIKIDYKNQNKIIGFLEQVSKMTMILNGE